MGHAAGDRLLIQVAKVLRQQCRALDVVRTPRRRRVPRHPADDEAERGAGVRRRVQASLREMEQANPEFGPCTLSMGVAESPAARHDGQQRARRGRHGALQGQAGRAQRRRGRGQLAAMALEEFILLGDALWLDFVNTARGRTPPRPTASPIPPPGRAGRSHAWTSTGGRRAVRRRPRVPRPAHRPRRGAARRPAPRRPGVIAALNEQLGRTRRPAAAHPRERRVAAAVRPAPAARRRSRRSPGRPRPRWPQPVHRVRRCAGGVLLPLLHRRLPERQPALVRPAAVRRRHRASSAGGARSGDRPRIRSSPSSAPRAALGPRYRLERIVAAERGPRALRGATTRPSSAGSASGSTSTATSRRGPGSCARPRRWASSTIPPSGTSTTPGVVGDLAYRIGNWIDGEGLEEAVGRGPRQHSRRAHARARPARRARARAPAGHHRPPHRARRRCW